ncbi:Oligopeptide transport system permease protein [Thaumarchaeota archaeon SCGC AB-539-E09]|nr:Oligopeptide transport system permease protein [Thaumarchaeota archaeon SCGC AB-539-E09]
MAFKKYIVKRALLAIPSIFFVLVLTFFLINSLTGNPLVLIIGEFETDPVYVERMMEKFGLNEPLHIRFIYYISNVLRGDLGYSINGPPVLGLILERIPATLMCLGSMGAYQRVRKFIRGA